MDAFTEANVLAVERLWPERRTMQTLVAGVDAWGRLAAATLPWLRRLKHRIRISAGGHDAGRSEELSTLPGRT
jgi:hypothetical protein